MLELPQNPKVSLYFENYTVILWDYPQKKCMRYCGKNNLKITFAYEHNAAFISFYASVIISVLILL